MHTTSHHQAVHDVCLCTHAHALQWFCLVSLQCGVAVTVTAVCVCTLQADFHKAKYTEFVRRQRVARDAAAEAVAEVLLHCLAVCCPDPY